MNPETRKLALKRIGGAGAALAASACVYALLFMISGMGLGGLWKAWEGASPAFLAGILVFSVSIHVFVGADKLWRVLRVSGFDLPWSDVLKIRLGSGPLRILLPVDAGEVLNVAFFRRYRKIPVADASGACLFDRGLNLLGSTFWLLWGLVLLAGKAGASAPWAASVAGVGLAYGLFLFAAPLHRVIIRLGARIHPRAGSFAAGVLAPFSRCSPAGKILLCGYGILFQARPLIVCYCLFAALGIRPDPQAFIALASLSVFAGHLPTASGVGPREAALMALFSGAAPAGTLFAVGAALSLVMHVIPMLIGLPWTPWFFRGIVLGKDGGDYGETAPP